MKIATFGSWIVGKDSPWKFDGQQPEFNDACRAIGQAIAKLGHSVIVGSSDSNSADWHIVQGVMSTLTSTAAPKAPLVEVIRPFDEEVDYADLSRKHPKAFK